MSTSVGNEMQTFPATITDGVRQAVANSFGSLLGVPPVYKAVVPAVEPGQGVVSVIAFSGDESWTMSLALPESTALRFVARFAGFDIPFDSPDMGDAVGELANVLAGEVTARLESKRIKAQMSLPTVARGCDVVILIPEGAPTSRLEFDSTVGRFWLILASARKGSHPCRRPGT